MFTKLPGRRVYIVLIHGEKEILSVYRLSKEHSWRIAEKCWVSGSENLKNIIKQHLHTSPHVVREGLEKKNQEKKKPSPEDNLQHIQLSDTTETSNGTGFYGQMKLKMYF